MYLHETQRELNVGLDSDHGEKMYRSFCNDHSNQGGKPEGALVRAPNDNEERG